MAGSSVTWISCMANAQSVGRIGSMMIVGGALMIFVYGVTMMRKPSIQTRGGKTIGRNGVLLIAISSVVLGILGMVYGVIDLLA